MTVQRQTARKFSQIYTAPFAPSLSSGRIRGSGGKGRGIKPPPHKSMTSWGEQPESRVVSFVRRCQFLAIKKT